MKINKLLTIALLFVCGSLSLTSDIFGQVSITTLDTPVTQNFDGIGNTATAALPSGWRMTSTAASSGTSFAAAQTNTSQAAGTTGTGALSASSAGGAYNFANGVTASSTERAIGFLASGSFAAPRNTFAQLQNSTGGTIVQIDLNFNYEKFRTAPRGTQMNFYASTDGVNWTPVTDGSQAFPADTTTLAINPPAQTPKTVILNGLSIPDGAQFYLRWEYTEIAGGSGGRQAVGIDDVSITARGSVVTTPTITVSSGTLTSFGNVSVGTTSPEKVYTVSGANLTENIVINAPPEFLISTTSGSGYTSSVVLTPTSGTVDPTDIFVVFAPASAGPKSGTITHTSAGAPTQNVNVSGTGVQSFTINGTVTYKGAQPLSNTIVIAQEGGITVASAVTNASGSYSMSVPGGGNYTVSVLTSGFAFTPASQTFPALSANQTQNFNATAATLLISEFRFRGTSDTDDYVEIYNSTDAVADISGFAIVTSDNPGVPKFVAPGAPGSKTTTIPARGHYLITGLGYSLGSYAAGDGALLADIPDGAGVGLFVSSTVIATSTRVDATGYAPAAAPFSEGTPLNPPGGVTNNGETGMVRKFGTVGYPADTDNNIADFLFVSTDAGTYNGLQSILGAPGPENRQSPIFRPANVTASILDSGAGITAPPNRVVDPSNTAAAPLGTIASRRTYTNTSGLAITKFRLRIIGVSTIGSPQVYNPQAVVKALSSADINVTKSDSTVVPVKGLTIEAPPNQLQGGGLNSSLIVTLSQPINPGESINVDTIIGVIASGRLIFNTAVEVNLAAPQSLNVNVTMGNPSNAVTNAAEACNYLMEKPQYVLAYCRDRGTPNWVSWHLDTSWLGSTPRQNDFRNDPSLPPGWYQVQGTDYSGSGFDRGHHTPSGDRTASVADNSATFFMTNMMPQAPDNNQGPWEQLESYSRTLAAGGNEMYIVMGGYGTGGSGSNGGTTNSIAGGKVIVPNVVWKVILVLPSGTNDVSRVTTTTRTIAVIMPNTQGIRTNDWRSYRVSVDQVEALTGLDFFSNVPAPIQNVIEAVVDNQP